MRFTGLFTFIFCVPLVFAAPVPKEQKKGISLDGAWEIVGFQSNLSKVELVGYIWTIHGEELTIDRPDREPARVTGRILKPRRDIAANAYDYVFPNGHIMLCTVEVQGDVFKISMTDADDRRPKSATPGEGVTYFEFKRRK